ncbi:MAG TPA: hypothetical protein VGP77_03100 [Vicinamibacterales bacterium]|jgi:hypothetical protein|nr:hypothetical protein [Vicinamibacterales bacterium]
MRSWPALLLAPLIALADLSIIYALVTPACMRQDRIGLHTVALCSLAIVLVLTLLALQAWRDESAQVEGNATVAAANAQRGVTRADGVAAIDRQRFVALVAVLVGAFSVLVCSALWLPIWLLSPCY